MAILLVPPPLQHPTVDVADLKKVNNQPQDAASREYFPDGVNPVLETSKRAIEVRPLSLTHTQTLDATAL